MGNVITEMCAARDYAAVKNLLTTMNVVDIAYELENTDDDLAIKVFRMLPKDKAAEIFAYLSRDMRENIVNAITDREIQFILDDLFLDDAVDFIEEMPAGVVKRLLQNVSKEKRDLINLFLKYPEGSVGSVMTIEFVELKEDISAKDAFAHIRETGVDKETIYTCYVIDNNRKLIGTISARTLLLADQDALIKDIMYQNIISSKTTDNQENLANTFRKYDLLAVPVVDNENRLVGIVTVDDALDVQEAEATEDFEIMAAISPSEEPYLKTKVWTHTKNRVVWLMLLMLSATLTGGIISAFEDALALVPALMSFVPMLMDTGGNSGAQSSTLVIRGMAIDEISLSDVWKVLWKELRVAFLCGGVLVVVNFVRILAFGGRIDIAFTVSLTLMATVILAKATGCLLPMGAKKLKLDPAVMASPVITTIVDAASLVVFFLLSKMILNL